ncbi:hypothetical protein M8J77_013780 [Diaphorina citri]|nr:hypothetical protein M8J77_013780 [Diaphorina citri]
MYISYLCDFAIMFADLAIMFADLAIMFADLAFMFADLAIMFADFAIMFADLAILFADLAIMFADLAFMFADLAIMFADFAIMFADLAILFADLAIMLCCFSFFLESMNQKSSKVEKLDWDRSQLSQILCTIQHNEKRSVRHGHFHSTGSRREDQDTVEKLASRVYFADRYKYGTGESFQNNQGRPFQLPRIQNNNTYKYEQTVWRHTSQDITLPGTIYSFPQPPSKKHTLNTIQTANILQDLNLFHNPQEEKTFTKLPKQILDVDPEFFKIIQGRRIKSKFDSNYVSNVRRVLLTKLRIGENPWE